MKAADDTVNQFESVNNSHKIRWSGKTLSKMNYYGGYTYLIERSGEVRQYRGEEEVGAHCVQKWKNYNSIGISFAGNMSVQELTEGQIIAAYKLIKDIQERRGIKNENIKPHRFYKSTQCPGNNLPDKVWDYLQEQYEKIKEKTPPIVKWHIKNKIIERWNNPPTDAEIKLGWLSYKILEAIKVDRVKKIKFNL